jgi:hypothetical protein
VWAASLAATLLLAACGAPALDDDQAAAERGVCASLRERVAARVLDEASPLRPPDGGDPTDADALSATTLRDDPETYYTALEKRLADIDLGPKDDPSPVSPAALLVDACRSLDP